MEAGRIIIAKEKKMLVKYLDFGLILSNARIEINVQMWV